MEKGKLYINKKHATNPFAVKDPLYYVHVEDVKQDLVNPDVYWAKINNKYMNSVDFENTFKSVSTKSIPLEILLHYFKPLSIVGNLENGLLVRRKRIPSKEYLPEEYARILKDKVPDFLEEGKNYKLVDNTFIEVT